MTTVNMLEAKSSLSRLVQAVESGHEAEIIIARNGKPVARLVPLQPQAALDQRIGVAKGLFAIPDDIDVCNDTIAELFFDEDALSVAATLSAAEPQVGR